MYVRVESFKNYVNSEFLNKTAKELNLEQTDYHYSYYPPFAIGSYGHVVSRNLAQYVVDNKENLFDYGGEDTSLGIWVHESPMYKEHKIKFHKSVPVMTNGKNCIVNKYHVIGHSLT